MKNTEEQFSGSLPPSNVELEKKLLSYLKKQQEKKQSIQTFVDFIPEGLFYSITHQEEYDELLKNHTRERRKDIPTEQSYWISDLIDLKKKRDLIQHLWNGITTVYANKKSFKIIKGRLFALIESI